ncbi:hypothetical protein Goari_021627 [Gossypium aridum]|uniref:Uncharacterized protein n=1 Tax=Gossypium aridum TaxID=34290 RepID=A0A7J8YFI2_GOSAI|nr:hypothetical protein [Gossypium aridum]
MVGQLMMDTTKDDLSLLPHIYSPETEYDLSAIYIDTTRLQGRYGTRNQSALTVKSNGEVCFYERYLDKDRWKENTVTYQIEMTTNHIVLAACTWIATAVVAARAPLVVRPTCGLRRCAPVGHDS